MLSYAFFNFALRKAQDRKANNYALRIAQSARALYFALYSALHFAQVRKDNSLLRSGLRGLA